MTGAELVALLEQHRFASSEEAQLQDGIAAALIAAGVPHTRELRLGTRDRIDFLVGTVGLEVKIDGSLPALARQLQRYAEAPIVSELVVFTTRARLAQLPATLLGKPVRVALQLGVG